MILQVKHIATTYILLLLTHFSFGKDIYVGKNGNDNNDGTSNTPYLTIQKAVDMATAGDTIYVLEGIYRESVVFTNSGTNGAPIKIIGSGNNTILEGSDSLTGTWEPHANGIYRIKLTGKSVEQAFINEKPLSPARWPNASFEETWIRPNWANSTNGSKMNLLVSKKLPETGIDWTGAIAVMNLAHQYRTWSRVITAHSAGSDRFSYVFGQKLTDGGSWKDDQFYITGTLKALDVPGEFFHDTKEGWFYYMPENGTPPSPETIQIKKRDYVITGDNVSNIEISNFKVLGATIRFFNANFIKLSNITNFFPSFTLHVGGTLLAGETFQTPSFGVTGTDNTIENCHVAYAWGSGITTLGKRNKIMNCLVHDVNYSGDIAFKGIGINKLGADEYSQSLVSHCTVYNTGNIGIEYRGRENTVANNIVHHNGLTCHDIAAVHTGSPLTAGSEVKYNIIYKANGKAARGDNQTRNLTIHHNLVYACKEGIIAKGDLNKVYHNTILGKLEIRTKAEPKLWWTKWPTLSVQNANSMYFNNYVGAIKYNKKPLPENTGISDNHIYQKTDYKKHLKNPVGFATGKVDASLKASSNLIDAGRIVEGLTDDYEGNAPDIGAFEYGKTPWKAGTDLDLNTIPFFLNIDADGTAFDVTNPKEIILSTESHIANTIHRLQYHISSENNQFKIEGARIEAVYNSLGQKRRNQNLEKGIYFIKIRFNNKTIKTVKAMNL